MGNTQTMIRLDNTTMVTCTFNSDDDPQNWRNGIQINRPVTTVFWSILMSYMCVYLHGTSHCYRPADKQTQTTTLLTIVTCTADEHIHQTRAHPDTISIECVCGCAISEIVIQLAKNTCSAADGFFSANNISNERISRTNVNLKMCVKKCQQ